MDSCCCIISVCYLQKFKWRCRDHQVVRLTIIMHNRRCLIAIEIVYYRNQFPNSTCIFAALLQKQPKNSSNPATKIFSFANCRSTVVYIFWWKLEGQVRNVLYRKLLFSGRTLWWISSNVEGRCSLIVPGQKDNWLWLSIVAIDEPQNSRLLVPTNFLYEHYKRKHFYGATFH